GVIAALLTVLVATALTSDGDTNKDMVLEDAIDSQKVLSQPLEQLDGGTTDLASLQDGKPMLVNLWQSTCSPCVHEMPMLNDAQADNPDVTFIGVATQEPSLKDAKALAKQTGITYPWLLDDMGGVFYEANGKGMPTTLLVSASGTVIDTKSGPFANAKDLQAFIDQTE
ncbi:MAG: TlpA family protein disulfide reductase, partial [Aquihabitans sp.]